MDISVEYIKMCEKAGELQSQFFDKKVIPKDELFFIKAKGETVTFHDKDRIMYPSEEDDRLWFIEDTGANRLPIPFTKLTDDDFFYSYLDKESELNFIWLPRQDQLQEMVKPDNVNSYWLVHKMNEFVDIENAGELTGNPSMEQLWLSFVMREYKKKWNGATWIKGG